MTAAAAVLALPALAGAQAPPLNLSPSSGTQGASFSVTGGDWTPDSTVAIFWDGGAQIGSGTVDGQGILTGSGVAPAPASIGPHRVTAACASRGCTSPPQSATFTIVNSPPIANPDAITVQSGQSATENVVRNDGDRDGNLIREVVGVSSASRGAVTFSGRNVTYAAPAGFSGSDSFTYRICDQLQACSDGTVSVTVTSPPTTTTSSTTTTSTTTTTTTQPPTTTTTTTTTQPPTTTTTTRPGTTTTTTTRPPTTTTTSTSTTTTSTSTTTSTTTTTTRPGNTRPVVVQDAVDTEPGTRVTVDPLANDRDPDGRLDPATLTIVREPRHGAASVADGLIAYRPEPGYEGEDSLVYRVCDDGGLCNAARVVFTVAAPAGPVTPTTVPEEQCEIDPADVVAFTADPPRGPAGIDVFLDLEVSADVVAGCLLPEVQFTFDGGALGPPVPLQPNPGASATVTVPADAPVGTHTVGATQLGAAPVEIGTTEFEVTAVTSSGGAIPGWLPPAAGGAAAVVAAAVLFRRRPDYRHVPVTGGGECSSVRQRLLDARQDAARAAASADEAAVAAANARTAADGARADLLRCRDGGAAGGDDDMRMMGAKPVSQDAGEVGEGFHLLDYENPNAPLQDDGHFGWYFPGRAASVSGVVLHVTRAVAGAAVEGPAMSVADTYSKAQVPRSVHAVVDDTGAVPLLPDDYTALHTPGSDDESLAMEVVWEPAMGEDAEVLENAASWFAAKVRQHGIPARHVTRDEWLAGKEGIIGHEALLAGGDDLGFPWERFLDLVDAAEKLPQPVALRIHRRADQTADPCRALSEQAHTAESGALTAEQEAGSLQATALSAQSQVEAQREAVWDCECRTPAEEVPPTPEEDEPEHRRDRFYLLEHENPLAKTRANGKRGHYSTVRKGLVRGIVVHTAEGDDAAGVADYFATVKRAVSGHVVVDPQGWVKLLPDRYAAFHARKANDATLGLLFACHAADWGDDPVADAAMLRLGAVWAGIKARLYGIPLKRLTKAEWKAGERGFVAHSDIDRGFSDPGDGFDWDAFLAMAGGRLLTPQ